MRTASARSTSTTQRAGRFRVFSWRFPSLCGAVASFAGRDGDATLLSRLFLFVLRYLVSQLPKLVTRKETDLVERGELLFRLGHISRLQVGFAEVLVGAAMLRIQRKRLIVVLEREIHVAAMALGVAKIVVDVGVLVVA